MLLAAMIMLASCGGNSGKPEKTPSNVIGSNFVKHECEAGTFYIEVVRNQQPRGPGAIMYATAIYDSKGKKLLDFGKDRLLHWSGVAGILDNEKHENSLFSFRTFKAKPIGWSARLIKEGRFIVSRSLPTEKFVHRFWGLEGHLLWEGDAPRVLFDADMSKGDYVGLEYYDRPRMWLDLATGNTSPFEGSWDSPPSYYDGEY